MRVSAHACVAMAVTSSTTILAFRAVLAGAVACDLCKDNRWLFAISTGRSGSTTLMKMVNALPQVYMAGENGNMMVSARTLARPYASHEGDVGERQHGAHWHAARVDDKSLLCDLQQYTRDLLVVSAANASGQVRYIGFKEIDYDARLFEFMTELFPCAKFIINYRLDVVGQRHAGFYRHKYTTNELAAKNAAYLGFAASHNTFLLPLENFTAPVFDELRAWLGIEGCHFTAVYHENANGGYSAAADAPRFADDVIDDPSACTLVR